MAAPYKFVHAPPDYPGTVYRWRRYRRCLEHHLVFWMNTGRLVPAGYLLHHKDNVGINNSFDNLELVSHGDHSIGHNKKHPDLVSLECAQCSVSFTRPGRWYANRSDSGQERFFCSSTCAAGWGWRGHELRHGTSSGYGAGKCRCDLCRAWNRDKQRKRRAGKSTGDA